MLRYYDLGCPLYYCFGNEDGLIKPPQNSNFEVLRFGFAKYN